VKVKKVRILMMKYRLYDGKIKNPDERPRKRRPAIQRS
jgi:hypothetical protein